MKDGNGGQSADLSQANGVSMQVTDVQTLLDSINKLKLFIETKEQVLSEQKSLLKEKDSKIMGLTTQIQTITSKDEMAKSYVVLKEENQKLYKEVNDDMSDHIETINEKGETVQKKINLDDDDMSEMSEITRLKEEKEELQKQLKASKSSVVSFEKGSIIGQQSQSVADSSMLPLQKDLEEKLQQSTSEVTTLKQQIQKEKKAA